MKFKGKLFGAFIGVIIGGPIGMAFGFILGHLHDLGYFNAMIQATRSSTYTASQLIFFNNTFKIMGYIAKVDGRVSENEIQIARTIMSKMGLSETQKQEAIRLFAHGKQPEFDLALALTQLRGVCHLQPALLQIFLDMQLQMAQADGPLSSAKKAALQDMCTKLGIRGFQFDQQQWYQQDYQRQQYHQQRQTRDDNALSVDQAYVILGVSRGDSSDAIKKAYRRLMSQNHPDKLIAKGLPPEMIKVATQKTQRIKAAYEVIKKRA